MLSFSLRGGQSVSHFLPLPPPLPALLQRLFKQFHSHCTLLWAVHPPSPCFSSTRFVFFVSVSLYLCPPLFILVHFFTLSLLPFTFPPGGPASLDIRRFRVALKTSEPPLRRQSFLDLRGAGGRKLGQIGRGTGKRKYIFTLRLSQRRVIVE